MQADWWSEDEVNNRLKKLMERAYGEVSALAAERKVSMRTAAQMIGVGSYGEKPPRAAGLAFDFAGDADLRRQPAARGRDRCCIQRGRSSASPPPSGSSPWRGRCPNPCRSCGHWPSAPSRAYRRSSRKNARRHYACRPARPPPLLRLRPRRAPGLPYGVVRRVRPRRRHPLHRRRGSRGNGTRVAGGPILQTLVS